MLLGIYDDLLLSPSGAAAAPTARKRFYLSGLPKVAMAATTSVIMSDDMVNFTSASLPWGFTTHVIAAGNDIILASGAPSRFYPPYFKTAISTDGGVSFQDTGLQPPSSGGPFNIFNSLCFGRGLFVATCSPLLYTSPDGRTWTPRTPGFTASQGDVSFVGGKFIHVGYDGVNRKPAFAVSQDGVSWARGPDIWPSSDAPLTPASNGGVTYLNNRWIFWTQGYNGPQVAVTTDLANFQKVAMPWAGGVIIGVEFFNGAYHVIAVNQKYQVNQSTAALNSILMATSTDLRTWTNVTPVGNSGQPLYFGVLGGRMFLVNALTGTVQNPGAGPTWSYTASSSIECTFSLDGRTFSRLATPDLLYFPTIAGLR